MIFDKHKRLLYLTIFILTINACSVSKNSLINKRIVINRGGHKKSYKIQVPQGDTGIIKIYGGHGAGFEIHYADSSLIYYTNDMYLTTPNYFGNYKSINFKIPIGSLRNDTIILGKQEDGRYWKEIFHNGHYIGYKNIRENKIAVFDKSLMTFKQKR